MNYGLGAGMVHRLTGTLASQEQDEEDQEFESSN